MGVEVGFQANQKERKSKNPLFGQKTEKTQSQAQTTWSPKPIRHPLLHQSQLLVNFSKTNSLDPFPNSISTLIKPLLKH